MPVAVSDLSSGLFRDRSIYPEQEDYDQSANPHRRSRSRSIAGNAKSSSIRRRRSVSRSRSRPPAMGEVLTGDVSLYDVTSSTHSRPRSRSFLVANSRLDISQYDATGIDDISLLPSKRSYNQAFDEDDGTTDGLPAERARRYVLVLLHRVSGPASTGLFAILGMLTLAFASFNNIICSHICKKTRLDNDPHVDTEADPLLKPNPSGSLKQPHKKAQEMTDLGSEGFWDKPKAAPVTAETDKGTFIAPSKATSEYASARGSESGHGSEYKSVLSPSSASYKGSLKTTRLDSEVPPTIFQKSTQEHTKEPGILQTRLGSNSSKAANSPVDEQPATSKTEPKEDTTTPASGFNILGGAVGLVRSMFQAHSDRNTPETENTSIYDSEDEDQLREQMGLSKIGQSKERHGELHIIGETSKVAEDYKSSDHPNKTGPVTTTLSLPDGSLKSKGKYSPALTKLKTASGSYLKNDENKSSLYNLHASNFARKSSESVDRPEKLLSTDASISYGTAFSLRPKSTSVNQVASDRRKSVKKRKSLVALQFKDALRSGQIKDTERESVRSNKLFGGFPLAREDALFYEEAKERAKERQTRLIPGLGGHRTELPDEKSFNVTHRNYQEIHETRLKLQKEIDDFRRGTQKSVFTPLSEKALDTVQKYFSKSRAYDDQMVADAYKVRVTYRDLRTLQPGTWLNDTVIDFYLAHVTQQARESRVSQSFAFSTHFFTTLTGDKGYAGVARWAMRKKIDVTKMDYVFVPINQNNSHWCLAVINNADRRYEFYNSLSGDGTVALQYLEDYMIHEADRIDSSKHDEHVSLYTSYEHLTSVKCPKQQNGVDCGVFTCTNVSLLANRKPLNYTQKDVSFMRLRMAYEIINYENTAKM